MGFIFNVITRLIKAILKLSLYLAIFATIIVIIPNLPPNTKFTKIVLTPTQPKVGPLAPNEALNNAERLYKGKLLGPEAFQIYKGELYTSLATGEIVKLSAGGHVTFVTTVGQPCSGLTKEHICGRPLGFQIDEKENALIVADAYHGIWKVDLKTDKKQLLVSPRVEIEKRQPKLFNSIALGKNGDFYWTDSTSDFNLMNGAMSMLSDPSGRLFHYDATKNESKVLLDNLWFANGVVLSPKNDFVVVAESVRSKLTKYYVAGPKKGKSEVFIDGIPGIPDNMRVLPDGSGILVGLYTVHDDENPTLTRSLAPTPVVRKFLTRLQRLVEIPFEYLNNLYPHIVFEDIVYRIGHFSSISGFIQSTSGLLQLDWNGNIVAAYYNSDHTLGHISDAIVYNNKLYTGSPHLQDYVGAIPAPALLKSAFEPSRKPESAKMETTTQGAKPDQQTSSTQKTMEQPQANKVDEKPKTETKPKAEPKPIVDTPKVADFKESPKEVKPTAAAPKPVQQAESPKQNQKPAPQKPSAKATEASKKEPTSPKPISSGAKVETKKATQTEPKPTKPKPEVTSPPKATENTNSPPPKPVTSKPKETRQSEDSKKAQPVKQEPPKTPESKPKPIKEEITSDTVKPTKQKLKVIKKDGPTEIPVPNQ